MLLSYLAEREIKQKRIVARATQTTILRIIRETYERFGFFTRSLSSGTATSDDASLSKLPGNLIGDWRRRETVNGYRCKIAVVDTWRINKLHFRILNALEFFLMRQTRHLYVRAKDIFTPERGVIADRCKEKDTVKLVKVISICDPALLRGVS